MQIRLLSLLLTSAVVAGPVLLGASSLPADLAPPPAWDTFSDSWVATDGLGRSLPLHAQAGSPRPDRFVGIFYFLWHGAHIQGGPYDVSKILAQDPAAMQKKDSPLWGPLHAPHHWGESIFGYYRTDDPAVLRKHAQMLSDAGVDAIIFDVSNQLTYQPYYQALLRVFAEVRQQGGRPPHVAFLCPFWDPAKVVHELYRDLYEPGLFPELWFRWEGKPLILADPAMIHARHGTEQQDTPVPLLPDGTLGQSFSVDEPLARVGGRFPTWGTSNAAMTLTLRRQGPGGQPIASQRFEAVPDNAWLTLQLTPSQPAGPYYLEMSAAAGRIGWWSHASNVFARGEACANGQPVPGDRTLRLLTRTARTDRLLAFFTFRRPQPDYFLGPTEPDMWSWLEIHPQHAFTNALGQTEQMSVGVAQNAVGNRLGSMSEPGARGRSFHRGAQDTRPRAVLRGFNLAEQWDRALRQDPSFIFITGWNEWIAGRFDEFNGVRLPVMFVDQFDQEHSRDIEPMTGGHGDHYYYQMTGSIRRFKGVRPLTPVRSRPISIDGRFEDWRDVQPEFRDTIGDPVRRDHPGWAKDSRYVNHTGRNDLVAAKASRDANHYYFYARTREPLSPATDPNWMLLFLDTDTNATTGWLGYDFIVNRASPKSGTTLIERNSHGQYAWERPVEIPWRTAGPEIEIAIPLALLAPREKVVTLDFKWADHPRQTGHWSDFTLNGDAAPNDRFNYRARFE